jgi:hypothetical protein
MPTQGSPPPPLPSDLTPNPPPQPAPPPCSCANYVLAKNKKIDIKSLHAIVGDIPKTFAAQGIEKWGPDWVEPLLPPWEWYNFFNLEIDLWNIQEEVSAKYKHCEQ